MTPLGVEEKLPEETRDAECVAFLQWALPRLNLRWPGFRKPRRQVCRRIARRARECGCPNLEGYRRLLEAPGSEAEWRRLESLCRVTISRFFRDRAVWEELGRDHLPRLAREARAAGRPAVRAWSAGCASGEEPYSLRLVWELGRRLPPPSTGLEILGTDVDERLLGRARRARYPAGCLRELPEPWRREAFRRVPERATAEEYELREPYRRGVDFLCLDLREAAPGGPFDLVLCRNLAWTYFDQGLQLAVLDRVRSVTRVGGVLVIGAHEELPAIEGFDARAAPRCSMRRVRRHAECRKLD